MSGELGTGDTVNRCLSGGAFTVVPAGVKLVRVGLRSTCFVIASTGELKCMGDNDKWILGTGDKYPFPRTILGL